jgi:tetratricopeptide (TPR) repeat protein
LKNRLQEAIARISTDNAGSNSGDKQELLDTYKQALSSSSVGEGALLNSLGSVYFDLGERQKALEYFNQALMLFRAEKQRWYEAITLSSIGNLYFNSGETQLSLDSYKQALAIQQAEKDTAAQSETLNSIGQIYGQLGESQKALSAFNQALKLQQERKDLAGQANILSQIASLYYSLGENQKAQDFYSQALKFQQAAQENLSGVNLAFNLSRQALLLTGIAVTYASPGFGDRSKALDFFNQAQVLYQQAGNRDGEAHVLQAISRTYYQFGEKHNALDALNQSIVLWRAIPNP